MKVPIRYGPKDQLLARVQDNTDLVKEIAIQYPRMSYEMLGLSYDSNRSKNKLGKAISTPTGYVYNPVPYNLGLALYIVTKNSMDGFRIIEQILPIFNPTFNLVVNFVDGMNDSVPVTLGAVQQQDNWVGSFEQREIIWTLTFTSQIYMYGPNQNNAGLIKQVIANFKDYDANTTLATVIVQPGVEPGGRLLFTPPGVTTNKQSTTNIAISIPYQDINSDDPFGIITRIIEP